MTQEKLENIIQSIPKAELHLHLRGAIPLSYISRQIDKYSPQGIKKDIPFWQKAIFLVLKTTRPFIMGEKWTETTIQNLFNTKTFTQFLISFYFSRYFIKNKEDFQELAYSVLNNLKLQNIVYAEITVSIADYENRGINFSDLMQCLEKVAQKKIIKVHWIIDVIRDAGKKGTIRTLEKVIANKCSSVIGINLGGSEHLYPAKNYGHIFERAKKEGFRLTVHAGEAKGAESVWDAIRILNAERIGHGVRSIEDPSLVRYLAENKIALEVCPTSNIFTGTYRSYEEHPIKQLFEAGVPITINTDDPTFFRTTLNEEYIHAHQIGIGVNDLMSIIQNGFFYSFLREEEKRVFLSANPKY
jgi:adenosine deaminase